MMWPAHGLAHGHVEDAVPILSHDISRWLRERLWSGTECSTKASCTFYAPGSIVLKQKVQLRSAKSIAFVP